MAHKIVNRRIVIYDEQLFSVCKIVRRHRCRPFHLSLGPSVLGTTGMHALEFGAE